MKEKTQDEIDLFWMKKAFALAHKAAKENEVPVGALLINTQSNTLVSKGFNLRETLNSPLAHAELLAIHRASSKLQSWRLSGHTLYVTLEPCAMCCGAILQSRVDRVVFGTFDSKGGATALPLFNQSTVFKGSVLERECRQILKDFFSQLRQSKSKKKNKSY